VFSGAKVPGFEGSGRLDAEDETLHHTPMTGKNIKADFFMIGESGIFSNSMII
jgi:hypothetical protein